MSVTTCSPATPSSEREVDDPEVKEALGAEDVVEPDEIPHIAFRKELYETLPGTLVNALPYNVVLDVQSTIDKTYKQASYLREDRLNDLGVLLCYCMDNGVSYLVIRKWAVSDGGKLWFRRTIQCLYGSGSKEQVALSVTALLSYQWFSDFGEYDPARTSYSYLGHFRRSPAGNGFELWQAWRHMAWSLRRFLGEEYVPRPFTDMFSKEEPLSYWPPGLVEMYRMCRDGVRRPTIL